jgi:glutathione S-transferase
MVKIHLEADAAKKAELRAKLDEEIFPNSLKTFEQRLIENGSGYLAGSSLTYADLHLFNMLDYLGEKKEAVLGHFPHVHKLDQAVRGHAHIAAWLAKRPVTAM